MQEARSLVFASLLSAKSDSYVSETSMQQLVVSFKAVVSNPQEVSSEMTQSATSFVQDVIRDIIDPPSAESGSLEVLDNNVGVQLLQSIDDVLAIMCVGFTFSIIIWTLFCWQRFK